MAAAKRKAQPRPRVEKVGVCALIAAERTRKKDEWSEQNPVSAPGQNPYTQENVAQRVPVSIKTYRGWERDHEPSFRRLRQIARALDLPPGHFLPDVGAVASTAPSYDQVVELVRESLAAQADQVAQTLERIEALVRAAMIQAGLDPGQLNQLVAKTAPKKRTSSSKTSGAAGEQLRANQQQAKRAAAKRPVSGR